MTIRASFALVLLSVTVPSTHATFPSTFSTEFFGGNESDVIYRTAFDDSALVFVVSNDTPSGSIPHFGVSTDAEASTVCAEQCAAHPACVAVVFFLSSTSAIRKCLGLSVASSTTTVSCPASWRDCESYRFTGARATTAAPTTPVALADSDDSSPVPAYVGWIVAAIMAIFLIIAIVVLKRRAREAKNATKTDGNDSEASEQSVEDILRDIGPVPESEFVVISNRLGNDVVGRTSESLEDDPTGYLSPPAYNEGDVSPGRSSINKTPRRADSDPDVESKEGRAAGGLDIANIAKWTEDAKLPTAGDPDHGAAWTKEGSGGGKPGVSRGASDYPEDVGPNGRTSISAAADQDEEGDGDKSDVSRPKIHLVDVAALTADARLPAYSPRGADDSHETDNGDDIPDDAQRGPGDAWMRSEARSSADVAPRLQSEYPEDTKGDRISISAPGQQIENVEIEDSRLVRQRPAALNISGIAGLVEGSVYNPGNAREPSPETPEGVPVRRLRPAERFQAAIPEDSSSDEVFADEGDPNFWVTPGRRKVSALEGSAPRLSPRSVSVSESDHEQGELNWTGGRISIDQGSEPRPRRLSAELAGGVDLSIAQRQRAGLDIDNIFALTQPVEGTVAHGEPTADPQHDHGGQDRMDHDPSKWTDRPPPSRQATSYDYDAKGRTFLTSNSDSFKEDDDGAGRISLPSLTVPRQESVTADTVPRPGKVGLDIEATMTALGEDREDPLPDLPDEGRIEVPSTPSTDVHSASSAIEPQSRNPEPQSVEDDGSWGTPPRPSRQATAYDYNQSARSARGSVNYADAAHEFGEDEEDAGRIVLDGARSRKESVTAETRPHRRPVGVDIEATLMALDEVPPEGVHRRHVPAVPHQQATAHPEPSLKLSSKREAASRVDAAEEPRTADDSSKWVTPPRPSKQASVYDYNQNARDTRGSVNYADTAHEFGEDEEDAGRISMAAVPGRKESVTAGTTPHRRPVGVDIEATLMALQEEPAEGGISATSHQHSALSSHPDRTFETETPMRITARSDDEPHAADVVTGDSSKWVTPPRPSKQASVYDYNQNARDTRGSVNYADTAHEFGEDEEDAGRISMAAVPGRKESVTAGTTPHRRPVGVDIEATLMALQEEPAEGDISSTSHQHSTPAPQSDRSAQHLDRSSVRETPLHATAKSEDIITGDSSKWVTPPRPSKQASVYDYNQSARDNRGSVNYADAAHEFGEDEEDAGRISMAAVPGRKESVTAGTTPHRRPVGVDIEATLNALDVVPLSEIPEEEEDAEE